MTGDNPLIDIYERLVGVQTDMTHMKDDVRDIKIEIKEIRKWQTDADLGEATNKGAKAGASGLQRKQMAILAGVASFFGTVTGVIGGIIGFFTRG